MKEVARKESMTRKNLIPTTGMSLEELFHQEYFSQTGTKISFLVIFSLAITLVTNK
jgi:hypothetical protein